MKNVHADMSTEVHDDSRASFTRLAALVVGVAFLAVGVLGFIPGITTNYGDLQWAGHESEAQLLGLFQVSVLHNVVHLVFGVAGILLARTTPGAVWYLIGGGAIYGFLWLYGVGLDDAESSSANFVPLDDADNWLHLALSVAMLLLGFYGFTALSKRGHLHHGPGDGSRLGAPR